MFFFIFPPHLFSASTLPWTTVEAIISKNFNKIMNISQENLTLI